MGIMGIMRLDKRFQFLNVSIMSLMFNKQYDVMLMLSAKEQSMGSFGLFPYLLKETM